LAGGTIGIGMAQNKSPHGFYTANLVKALEASHIGGKDSSLSYYRITFVSLRSNGYDFFSLSRLNFPFFQDGLTSQI
jgi:hypothetical protein